jgi:hypothetical protein
MIKSKHCHGTGPYLLRPISILNSASNLPSPQSGFTARFQNALHPSEFNKLVSLGFLCEADVANLRCSEIVEFSNGFFLEDEAQVMIELAKAVCKGRLPPQQRQPQPHICQGNLVSAPACIGPVSVRWRACSKLRVLSDSDESWFDFFWGIYLKLGRSGLQYSPLLDSQPEHARFALFNKLTAFERTSLKSRLSAWRRWVRFVEACQPAGMDPTSPTLEATFEFLQVNATRGPTVAQGLFQQLLWWRSHVGVPFILNDPLMMVWNRPAENHRSVQHDPLPIPVVLNLVKVAVGPCPIAAAFAGFALLPLVACLRFAHVQRSTGLKLQGPFLLGFCTRGKSRDRSIRKPFDWACPHSFLGSPDVFRQALLVINDLRGRLDCEPSFIIPDLVLGPSASIGHDAAWQTHPMSFQKFISLLRLLVSQSCDEAPADVTSYSLRRFLPTIAEILRCPPEIAQHLGNWTESVKLAHVQSHRMVMSQHYAHDKVATAADSKAKLLQAILRAKSQLGSREVTFQALRETGILWDSVAGTLPPTTGTEALPPSPSVLITSSSSSSSSSEDGELVQVEWFQLPRGVVHILKPDAISLAPLCRREPFSAQPCARGAGIEKGMQICAKCIQQAPRPLLKHIQSIVRSDS